MTKPRNYNTFPEKAIARIGDIPSLCGRSVLIDEDGVVTGLTEQTLTIPIGAKVIAGSAFADEDYDQVKLPEGLIEIGDNAFVNNSIKSLNIPRTLTTIGNNAFKNNKISVLFLPDNVQTVGAGAFTTNLLTSVSVPGGKSPEFYEELAAAFDEGVELVVRDGGGYGRT